MVKINEPNFMCIGAAKSATTSLFDILKQHPLISVSSFKEPHFFDNSNNYKKGKQWYLESYFSNNDSKKAIGEFTPTYLSSSVCPKRILATFGSKMKFIVMLRNPINRAYSHYLHTKRDEHEDLGFIDAVLKEEDRLKQFNTTDDFISFCQFGYIFQGQYAQHINNYLSYFPIDQFHFVLFDDFVNKRKETVDKILSFLNVGRGVNLELNISSNQASEARSIKVKKFMKKQSLLSKFLKFLIPSLELRQRIRNRIHAKNNKVVSKVPLTLQQREFCYRNYFYKQILDLERILAIDLNIWKL